ncbi:MAG: hypothetical protein KJ000_12055 [Pirellulaceae bacterium]|nr:hypothetical protein [Pirellulaceae bacterium]
MVLAEARRSLIRNFALGVGDAQIPPLEGYFADCVRPGCEAAADDYRLVPLAPIALRFLMTSSDCLTDGMIELQSRYQQFIPSDWGGHMDKGWRDIGVVGFNVEDGPVLDILEINPTAGYLDWAEPKLSLLHWERLLVRAVVELGRGCGATQIRLQPAHAYPLGQDAADAPEQLAQFEQALKQRYDATAKALGFQYDSDLDRFILGLPAAG